MLQYNVSPKLLNDAVRSLILTSLAVGVRVRVRVRVMVRVWMSRLILRVFFSSKVKITPGRRAPNITQTEDKEGLSLSLSLTLTLTLAPPAPRPYPWL
jgi:hypothetical protein